VTRSARRPSSSRSRRSSNVTARQAHLETALAYPNRDTDPCLATGAGWVAEEALVTVLHCLLLFPDDPVAIPARAATTSGDSDSIACLAGAFAGAIHGMAAWPAEWAQRIEYADTLAGFGRLWDAQ
jgi:ADP-ribosylglycohydrolase